MTLTEIWLAAGYMTIITIGLYILDRALTNLLRGRADG